MGGLFVGMGKEEERRRKERGKKKEIRPKINDTKKNVVCTKLSLIPHLSSQFHLGYTSS